MQRGDAIDSAIPLHGRRHRSLLSASSTILMHSCTAAAGRNKAQRRTRRERHRVSDWVCFPLLQVEYYGRETAYGEDAAPPTSATAASSATHIATWHLAARRVNGPTHMVRGLTPGLTYVFLVRAENSHGLSPPSNLSEPVALGTLNGLPDASNDVDADLEEARDSLLTDQAVRLLDAAPNSSTSVRLSWEVSVILVVGCFCLFFSCRAAESPSCRHAHALQLVQQLHLRPGLASLARPYLARRSRGSKPHFRFRAARSFLAIPWPRKTHWRCDISFPASRVRQPSGAGQGQAGPGGAER